MKNLNQKGFSMIELLVVLLIIGILSAVAAPLFINNSTKAIVSEAVAGAGAIRSGERTYYSQNSGYLAITSAALGATYFGTATGNSSSTLGVQIHGNKYFSPDAYTVATTGLAWSTPTPSGISTTPQDFLITVTGGNSDGLTGITGCAATNTTDGAGNCSAVKNFIVEMDDAGTIIYSSNNGTSWSTF